MPNSPNEQTNSSINQNRLLQELEKEVKRLSKENAKLKAGIDTQNSTMQKIAFFRWLFSKWIGEDVRTHLKKFYAELPAKLSKERGINKLAIFTQVVYP